MKSLFFFPFHSKMDILFCVGLYEELCVFIESLLKDYPMYYCTACGAASTDGVNQDGKGTCTGPQHHLRHSQCLFERVDIIEELEDVDVTIKELLEDLQYFYDEEIALDIPLIWHELSAHAAAL